VVGAFALAANNPGNQNVAVGQEALRNNIGDGNAPVCSSPAPENSAR
jgi:hypothetical protein